MNSETIQAKQVVSGYLLILSLLLTACATESHRAVDIEKVDSYNTAYTGKKTTLVVGKFHNRSSYLHGLFSADSDRLGNQSKTILKTHLQQTNRFVVVDRENLEEIGQEADYSGVNQEIAGARYVVTGDVTEFGRKVTGNQQLFGILGAGKKQIAYAKVSLNIVDVTTSQIVYSTQGAGEYELSNQQILGTGGTAGYDATLNGKVLNFAITEVVNHIVQDIDNGSWKIIF
jgi:curli biogenesis system outer membrane secretion channel CsgG